MDILHSMAGSFTWFCLHLLIQWLWQQWVKRSHEDMADQNRFEEQATRNEIRAYREQIANLALGLAEKAYLTPQDREIIRQAFGTIESEVKHD